MRYFFLHLGGSSKNFHISLRLLTQGGGLNNPCKTGACISEVIKVLIADDFCPALVSLGKELLYPGSAFFEKDTPQDRRDAAVPHFGYL